MLCPLCDSKTYSVGDVCSSNLSQSIHGSDIIFNYKLRTTEPEREQDYKGRYTDAKRNVTGSHLTSTKF